MANPETGYKAEGLPSEESCVERNNSVGMLGSADPYAGYSHCWRQRNTVILLHACRLTRIIDQLIRELIEARILLAHDGEYIALFS